MAYNLLFRTDKKGENFVLKGLHTIMFVRKQRYRMPKTLDDAAEKVISDLPGGHQEILSRMNDKQFHRFYEKVAKFILDDFDLWLGNEELLRSCYSTHPDDNSTCDPAKIILDRVREKLQEIAGIIIIT